MQKYEVICPYCDCPALLMDSKHIYRESYGKKIYFCLICGAYVGCHPGGTKPLGTPANKALRTARNMAHQVFDRIWKSRRMSRSAAYARLAEQMGLPGEKTHIGMFDLEQCGQVMRICARR